MSAAASVTALAALSLSAVACGGSEASTDTTGDTTSSRMATVGDAVAETIDAGTARVDLTFEFTRAGGYFSEAGDRDSAEGIVDFERSVNELGTGADRVIVDETSFYTAPEEPGETQWKRFDTAADAGGTLAPDVSFGRLDVTRQLDYVASIAASFEAAGEEDLRGAATTRYTGVGDAETLMRALVSDFVFAVLPWTTHASTVDPSDSVPFDVWIGEDGRVHKVEYDFPNFDSLVGDRTTIVLYDFGADIDIELPEEVIEG